MPGKPVSRRTLAASSLAPLSAGLAAGHAGVPGALVDRLKRVFGAGSRAPLPPPDATAAEYRRQRLAMLDAKGLSALNSAIAAGGIARTDGQPQGEALREALVTRDRKLVYRIHDGIPVLLAGEAIATGQVPDFPPA